MTERDDPHQDVADEQGAAPKAYHLRACPSCGAAISEDAPSCWLCKWDMSQSLVVTAVAAPPVASKSISPAAIASIAAAVVLGAATLASFAIAPGIGVLLAVLLIIVLFALIKSLRTSEPYAVSSGSQLAGDPIQLAYAAPQTEIKESDGSPHSNENMAVQVLKTIGIALLIGLAALIAFFTFCVICVVALTSV